MVRAVVYSPANIAGMRFWDAGSAVHGVLASFPVVARAVQSSPRMSPGPGFAQRPTVLKGTIDGLPNVLVGVVVHARWPWRRASPAIIAVGSFDRIAVGQAADRTRRTGDSLSHLVRNRRAPCCQGSPLRLSWGMLTRDILEEKRDDLRIDVSFGRWMGGAVNARAVAGLSGPGSGGRGPGPGDHQGHRARPGQDLRPHRHQGLRHHASTAAGHGWSAPTQGSPKDFKQVAVSAKGVSRVTLKNLNAKGWETGPGDRGRQRVARRELQLLRQFPRSGVRLGRERPPRRHRAQAGPAIDPPQEQGQPRLGRLRAGRLQRQRRSKRTTSPTRRTPA